MNMKGLEPVLVEVSIDEFVEYLEDAIKSDEFTCVVVDNKKVVMSKLPGRNGRVLSNLTFVKKHTKGE